MTTSFLGYIIVSIPLVKTTPNRKKPKDRNVRATKILNAVLHLLSESLVSVVCRRHIPGKTKIKIAAKEPRMSITERSERSRDEILTSAAIFVPDKTTVASCF